MVEWAALHAVEAGTDEIITVVGHQAEEVKEYLNSCELTVGDKCKMEFVMQEQQLGTGHAVMQALPLIENTDETVFVVFGDMPLLKAETLKTLYDYHKENKNSVTLLTCMCDDPFGYGHIVRDESGAMLKSVEEKDATIEEAAIKEVNTGVYCFETKSLVRALGCLDNKNAQNEYYLTDTLEILRNFGEKIDAFTIKDEDEILGVNDKVQLAKANEVMRLRINEKHMRNGVTIQNPANTFIGKDVKIGADTEILTGTILEGKVEIGEDCVIGPNSRLVDSKVGNGTTIQASVMLESEVANETKIGPFAYIRPGSKIGSKVKVGDYVEIKNASIGDKTAISHLTYVGDADVGRNCNLGCGVVFVNYDGHKKHRTVVGDNAFVGCNTNLVSPVVVEKDSYIAAGSTITDVVPEYSLAIARQRQIVKDNWVIDKNKLRPEKK